MKRLQKGGFTILEILVVIVIITIMVSAGGFYYADLQNQTVARKAREDAVNFANIVNDIYHTGQFGTTSEPLKHLNIRKGTYPNRTKMEAIRKLIVQSYGEQFRQKGDSSSEGNIVVANIKQFRVEKNISPVNADFSNQDQLRENAHKIIYAPLKEEVPPNTGGLLCNDYPSRPATDNYDYQCATAVIYYVAYEKGKYELRPVRQLTAGVAREFQK